MRFRFDALVACLALLPAIAIAAPKGGGKKATPTPAETPRGLDEPVDLDTPIDVPGAKNDTDPLLDTPIGGIPETGEAGNNLGKSFSDKELKFSIPSPGPEWVLIPPGENMPRIKGIFAHPQGEKVRSFAAIGVDANPPTKDPAAYAKHTYEQLSQIGFKVLKKGPTTIDGHAAFAIAYVNGNELLRFEHYFIAGPKGSIIVVAFQARSFLFEAEAPQFRTAIRAAKIP